MDTEYNAEGYTELFRDMSDIAFQEIQRIKTVLLKALDKNSDPIDKYDLTEKQIKKFSSEINDLKNGELSLQDLQNIFTTLNKTGASFHL